MPNGKSVCLRVAYLDDLIVLDGESDAIHTEARRILNRFMFSAQPLSVKSDTAHRVVLQARH